MSRRETLHVRLPIDAELESMLEDIQATHRRADKSEPGDRDEIVRYESLCSALEARAGAELSRSGAAVAPSDETGLIAGSFLRRSDEVIVPLTLPLQPGQRRFHDDETPPLPPAKALPIRDDLRGRRLVQARFQEQLEAALANPRETRLSALSPSGVHNRVLTETLRTFVCRDGQQRTDLPVVYRDGSRAQNEFAFRSLDLIARLPEGAPDVILRLTLLSIRHTEMDPVVDGAWLRNAEVSRPRPAAQTDDFVFHRSLEQLRALSPDGSRRVRLHIFQTGLETAVVGFLRAVVEFLLAHPGSLEVVPMFYAAGGRETAPDSVEVQTAGFEPGRPWATGR